ncbi:peptidoglycan DD-metalloendopeptidase family protein [Microvirga sp. 2MCAF38]|uniref:peptidoglycan DD-metalloendopeptidase family protein n=1 Tax=Microvirga sp. 2MCAF38 TaxID=3232989 RepID=UPI003F9E0E58
MRKPVLSGLWTAASRVVLVGFIGSAAAACSSDTIRLTENPFSNPFASSERVAEPQSTASTQSYNAPVSAVPTAQIQSQALPPVQGAQPMNLSAPQASVAPAPIAASGPAGWSANGGTRITVGNNDNLNMISQRYGVPANAILAASGLSSPAQVRPGQQVVIPVYNAGGAPTRVASAGPVAIQTPQAAPQTKVQFVDQSKPGNAAKVAAGPQPIDAGKQRVRPGMTASAPMQPAPVQVASASAEPLVSAAKPVETLPRTAPQQVAARVEPAAQKPIVQTQPAAPAIVQPEAKAPATEPEQTTSTSGDFRWPARGRVIAGFGTNGGNEGINIAVPEGTPVKAAESGVVTYAGSEVKGYGNLVLIRHENGFVSAYAHNGSLSVKRGEAVKRGQVIATSGQTGNVTSPQLHFELRKGASPVDPIPHLGG